MNDNCDNPKNDTPNPTTGRRPENPVPGPTADPAHRYDAIWAIDLSEFMVLLNKASAEGYRLISVTMGPKVISALRPDQAVACFFGFIEKKEKSHD
jgi:hypothetical protein